MTYDEQSFAQDLDTVLVELREMLLEKNRNYGDSALNPVRIFSKASADEQLLVRIDDKISRLARGDAAGEDTIHDLLGYLVLYRIAQRRRMSFPIEMCPGMHLKLSFEKTKSVAGPFVGKRVESPLEEKVGVVTRDDSDSIFVRWDGEEDPVAYSLKMFNDGLKQKWLLWVEDGAEPTYVVAAKKEKQDADQEEAKQEDNSETGGSASSAG